MNERIRKIINQDAKGKNILLCFENKICKIEFCGSSGKYSIYDTAGKLLVNVRTVDSLISFMSGVLWHQLHQDEYR